MYEKMIISDSARPLAYINNASESALSLRITVAKFEANHQAKRELVRTVEAFTTLYNLYARLPPTMVYNLLDSILAHCRRAYKAFVADINKCAEATGWSLAGWKNLAGRNNVSNFKYMLDAYASTIKIVVDHVALYAPQSERYDSC